MKIRLGISLYPHLVQQIDEIAKLERRSRNAVIGRLLEKILARTARKERREER